MTKLDNIEGIGAAYQKKLNGAGIGSVEDLLDKGATPKGRKDVAAKSGISDALILKWVNHADLYRIKGIGSEYSDLLEASGVDTVVELAARKPDNLCKKLVETNQAKKLVRKLPALSQVEDWVKQAKGLKRIISY
jgi:predicted flap endonuclease-1-like 5' DNA nuclease